MTVVLVIQTLADTSSASPTLNAAAGKTRGLEVTVRLDGFAYRQ